MRAASELEYLGVAFVAPDGYPCIVLRSAEKQRVLPIWVEPEPAEELLARDQDLRPQRPDTIETMAALVSAGTNPVVEVQLVSFYEGVFIASILLQDGEEIDARPSDAIRLALRLEVPLLVDEDVLSQAGLYVSNADIKEYFSIELADADDVAAGLADVDVTYEDSEFEALMADLGVTEEELQFSDDDHAFLDEVSGLGQSPDAGSGDDESEEEGEN